MLQTLDLVGIFVFAISGGLVAVRNQLDILGVVVLAMATGLGGGVIRDVVIGAVPPPAVADWRYLLVPVVAGLVAFWLHPAVGRLEREINVFDAFGLGLFCVAGALKAQEYGLGPAPSAALGMVTGVGGGIIRDLLAGRIPVIFRTGELYAIPALAGAAIAATGAELGVAHGVILAPAALVTIGWRLIAVRRGWRAPVPRLGPPPS
ncbi:MULTISPECIES: trimeric intracellular cation channel family protein [unclassified Nocardioides]|uniref:trimeric intracellular cation channel family protein n=1 Tax=unclassified Nocardioides TaxID=2615069 RepID=UPI001151DF3E|nr:MULTISPECIES: trimeric intracellular cation channel family protein [unclassified Nocardioides]TQK70276.1 putative membrane protein YeiH [Nocardioides sp. SLBN-35]WGY00498.1 trimeric intracellular cation channel family protein [Nocardioides sp. QY071]